MNVETASRLVTLRKKSGLSQEELAEKIGVSRQAISKWERAESSPDTDNLIALASVYGLRIDDMLNTDYAQADGVTINSEPARESSARAAWRRFPYPVLCVIIYMLLGFLWGLWHPGWLIFLTVPLWAALIGKSPQEEKREAEKEARREARRKARQDKRDSWMNE